MKLKLASNTTIPETGHLPDGALLVQYDDETEKPLDPIKLIGDVKKTSERAATFEKERDQLKTQYESLTSLFGGEDPEVFIPKARTAIETLEGLNSGELADAEKLKQVRAEAVSATEEKFKRSEAQFKAQIEKLAGQLTEANQKRLSHRVSTEFANSPLVKRMTTPTPMVEATYGKHFFEDPADGEIRAKDDRGEVIMSRTDPVNKASFDEALSILVDASPWKADILGGPGGSGPGTPAHSSGPSSGSKTISRSDFESRSPKEQARLIGEGFRIL